MTSLSALGPSLLLQMQAFLQVRTLQGPQLGGNRAGHAARCKAQPV